MPRIKMMIAVAFFISTLFLYPNESFPALNLSSGLKDLTDQITSSMTQKNKCKLAVMDFVNLDGSTDNFCRYLSEHLVTKIFLTNRFEVIERRLLSKVLDEAKLSMTGIIDEKTAQKLGNILGIDSICAGSVSDLGKIIEVNARLFDTSTGKIFAVASTQFQKDEMIASLTGQALTKQPKETKSINETAKATESIEVEIPEGYGAVVVDNSGGLTPIKKLYRKHSVRRGYMSSKAAYSPYFTFYQPSGASIEVKFSSLKKIKFLRRRSKYYINVEILTKGGILHSGYIPHGIEFYGKCDLGTWERRCHSKEDYNLKAIYIK